MKFILVIFSLIFSSPALAHEEHPEDSKQRVLGEFTSHDKYRVVLMGSEKGHLLGQPFQMELKVNCSGKEKPMADWEVKDSFSVCDMDPKSVKANSAKTAIALKVKMADIEDYYDKVGKGQKSPSVRCLKKTEIKKFSLKNLCQ